MGYIDFDIEDYVQSDEFNELKDKVKDFSNKQNRKVELEH